MSESDEASYEAALAKAPRWTSSQSLDLVYLLNEHCLAMLALLANDEIAGVCPLISANRDLWVRLDADARRRAARMPFVIVDLYFADEAWWRREIEAPASAVRKSDTTNGLPAELSERLIQEMLMFAWQMARTDPIAARVLFAMQPAVAEMIGALTPGEVRAIAARRSGEIRVRWDQDDRFWRELLTAAERGDDENIAELHLYAKLLSLGPLMPHKIRPPVD